MNLLSRLLRQPPILDADQRRRLATWQALPEPDLTEPLDQARFVVVDVESTGLDIRRDRLIAIGAVAVQGGRIVLADSFEVILRQDEVSDRDNILVHGIGGQMQRAGLPPAQALLDFLDYLGKSPLVAFHAVFDETMIRRAMTRHLGLACKRPWLDLAYVMPALLPAYAHSHKALDDWTALFNIPNYARHAALADALATAQLLLAALPLASAKKLANYKALQTQEKAERWLNRAY
ncbi:MAG: 3'-5' exonuclease [Thiobacillaceae bacterium]